MGADFSERQKLSTGLGVNLLTVEMSRANPVEAGMTREKVPLIR